jgi:hypothetical protein
MRQKVNQVENSNRFVGFENFDDDVPINRASETIYKISAKESVGNYKLKQHKP